MTKSASLYRQQLKDLSKKALEIQYDMAQVLAEAFRDGYTSADLVGDPEPKQGGFDL